MPLASGSRVGPYEVLSPIGSGGMGEVYRARDTKLERDVALKVLPDVFVNDPDRLARFRREAQVLASLNHPNIAAIHGLEESGGVRALVLELVEGPTLEEVISGHSVAESGQSSQATAPSRGRGATERGGGAPRGLGIDETLQITRQIAEALEAAHEKGVVHRDLKPANVKITPDGVVKVLDFGLAKAMEPSPTSANLSNSPTLSLAATHAGVILGTAAYMSPEQAKGLQADERSDVFSFGCVLYEMLTGRRPFDGDTSAETLAAVLMREPDLSALQPNLNPKLHDLLRRCLEKNPKRRWQAFGDLRVELETIAADPRGVPIPVQSAARPQPLWKRAMPVVITAIVGVTASIAAWNLKPSSPAVITRFPLVLPEGQQFTQVSRNLLAISPDGTRLVYVASNQLFLRSMAEMEAQPIPGTNLNVASPFFSPDSQWIGFFSTQDGTLKKVAVTGGAALTICKADPPSGVSWDEDQIVFGQGSKGIMRVSANGGEPDLVARVSSSEIAHAPQLVDDGRAVLFTLAKDAGSDRWDTAQIVVQSLSSGERKVVLRGGSDARYVPTGHLVYALGGTVLAVPFDVKKLEVQGGPIPVLEGVRRAANPAVAGDAQLTLSSKGSLVYIPGTASGTLGPQTLALVDRSGKVQPLGLPPQPYVHPRMSPDGNQLVVGTDDGKESIVWVYDLKGGGPARRLTFGGRNQFPIWTRDDRRIAFESDREGDRGLFWQPADGSGSAERLAKLDQGLLRGPDSWTPDGKMIAFSVDASGSETRSSGIWTLALDGERKPKLFLQLPSFTQAITHLVFSPDGRWMAYMSQELGGNSQVFVQPFPPTGAKYQISSDRGRAPLWSPDGKQLFYHNDLNNRFFAVDIRTAPSFSVGQPTPLPIERTVHPVPGQRNYDVTPDGKQFLVVLPASTPQSDSTRTPAQQINVVLNWFEELKTRVPRR